MTSITISVSRLRAVLEPVLAMVGTDDMLPVLRCVQLNSDGVRLTTVSTDRFRIGVSTEPLDTEVDQVPGQIAVPATDLRRILTMFKGDRYNDPQINLMAFTDKRHVRILAVKNTETLAGLPTLQLQVMLPEVTYPEGMIKLVREACASREVDQAPIGVNAALLASFKFAVRDGLSLRLHPGPDRKPLGITCGEHFAGALMPRRLTSDDSKEVLSLLELLEPLAAAEKANVKVKEAVA